MKVRFSTYSSNHYTSIEDESIEEFNPMATKEEIDKAYLAWLDETVGGGWEVFGKEDYISMSDYGCMTDEMKQKEFPNG